MVKEETITKKVAAAELYQRLNNLRVAGLAGICVAFLTAVMPVLNYRAIIAGIGASFLGWMLYKNEMYLKKLKDKYGLKTKFENKFGDK